MGLPFKRIRVMDLIWYWLSEGGDGEISNIQQTVATVGIPWQNEILQNEKW